LRQSIPRLTAIADDVSIKVKQQYEENPYPRWIKPAPAREAMSVADYFSSLFGLSGAGSQRDTVDILVAGCGTGQRLVETARQFKGAQVLAIDLSLASLAYARRQVEALSLDNVEFAEAGILNMGTMDRTFDIVDASGVLHHLSDPWAGWRALLARLRAGGFMEVCLYSALARRDINAARAFVAERGYRPSAPDIRRCRQDILASGTAWAKSVANCRDFFRDQRMPRPAVSRPGASNGIAADRGFSRREQCRLHRVQRSPSPHAVQGAISSGARGQRPRSVAPVRDGEPRHVH
jgi:SAM-dependent methyltransferase